MEFLQIQPTTRVYTRIYEGELKQAMIDQALEQKLADVDALLKLLAEMRCEVSHRGQAIRLKAPVWKNVARVDETMGEGYIEAKVRAVPAKHEAEILLRKVAKQAFEDFGIKKLSIVKSLQPKFATLLEEKKKLRRVADKNKAKRKQPF